MTYYIRFRLRKQFTRMDAKKRSIVLRRLRATGVES